MAVDGATFRATSIQSLKDRLKIRLEEVGFDTEILISREFYQSS